MRRDDVTMPESRRPGLTALSFEAELMLPKLVALDARENAGDGRENTEDSDESCEPFESDSSLSDVSVLLLRRLSCMRASISPGRGNLQGESVNGVC